jgi:hypothetical protein
MTTNTEFNLNSNDTYSRRDAISFLAKALGVVSVLPAYKGIEKVLGADALAFAQDKVVIGGLEREIVVPSDEKLLEWMKDPVEKTLSSLKGGYVSLNDSNYQREVFQEHIEGSKRRPVMVLFYTDGDGSKGNAALVKAIHNNFSEIKPFGYRMVRGNVVPYEEVQRLKSRYSLKDVPAVLFYKKNDDNKIEYLAQSYKGIVDLFFLNERVDNYNKAIPMFMLK